MSAPTQSLFSRFRNELGLVVAILAVLSITSMINQDYFREPWRNFRDIAQETSLVGIFALGAAIVIIAGGIDLSSGTMILFSASVCVLVTYVFAPIESGRPNPAHATSLVVVMGIMAAMVTGMPPASWTSSKPESTLDT